MFNFYMLIKHLVSLEERKFHMVDFFFTAFRNRRPRVKAWKLFTCAYSLSLFSLSTHPLTLYLHINFSLLFFRLFSPRALYRWKSVEDRHIRKYLKENMKRFHLSHYVQLVAIDSRHWMINQASKRIFLFKEIFLHPVYMTTKHW